MKMTYSPRADALYIYFGQHRRVEGSDELSSDQSIRVVDYSADGSVVGVEILGTKNGIDVTGLPRAEEIAGLLQQHGFRVIAHTGTGAA
jgi:uncharacterized protein YuzE